MLMQACEAGGMRVVSNPSRARAIHIHDSHGYHVNPGDVYESTGRERQEPEWPRIHDGRVVKVVAPWLGDLAVHDYRVVVMRRDPVDIQQSYLAAFGIQGDPPGLRPDAIEAAVRESVRALRNRRDVREVREIWYDDVLSNPASELMSMSWPLDVLAASAIVDPEKQRFIGEPNASSKSI